MKHIYMFLGHNFMEPVYIYIYISVCVCMNFLAVVGAISFPEPIIFLATAKDLGNSDEIRNLIG